MPAARPYILALPNSETDRDPFAFAGYEGDGDARVLALFHDWLDASREADRYTEDDADDDDAAFDAALDRRDEIERKSSPRREDRPPWR